MTHPLLAVRVNSRARVSLFALVCLAAIPLLLLSGTAASARPDPATVVLAEVSDASDFPGVDVAAEARKALLTALMDLKDIELIPQNEVDDALRELKLRFPLGDEELKQIGRHLEADLAVAARVLSCIYNEYANRVTVRMRVSIYDPKAGAPVRRTIVKGVSQTDDPRATVADLVANALKEAAYKSGAELLRSTGVTGTVLSALHRDDVLVDLTSADGVKVGTEFAVFDGQREVGRLVAIDVSAGRTVCQIKGDTPLDKFVPGLRVVIVSTPEQPLAREIIHPPKKKSSGSKALAVLAVLLIGYFIVKEIQRSQERAAGRGVASAAFRSPGNNTTVQAGQEVPVIVHFADRYGNPVPDGTEVRFTLSQAQLTQQEPFLGTIESPKTTKNGIAETTYRAGSAGTVVQITASIGRFSRSVIVHVGAGPAASITLSAETNTLPADGVSTTTITASVFDEAGNPVQDGQSVDFSTTAGTLSSTSVATTNGQATTVLSSALQAGVATITATTNGITATTSVVFTPGTVATILVEPVTRSVAAGTGTTIVRATLYDANHNLVADGTEVTWSIQPTNLGSISPSTGTTTAGMVMTTFTAGNLPGQVVITARSGAAIGQAEITIASTTAAGLTLLTSPPSVPADGVSTIRVTANVTDATGGPVADGTPVQFEITAGQGQIRSRSLTTLNGQAYVEVASTTVGQVEVTVTVPDGNQTAVALLTFTALEASSIQLSVAQTPIRIDQSGSASTTITGVVTDVNGRFVQDGTVVNLSTDLGTVSPGQVTTHNGQFTVTFSSIVTGVATVTATSGSASASVTITIQSGGAAAVILTADPQAIRADGSSFATITATVVDRSGNPVVDGTMVRFTAQVRTATGVEDATITPQAPTVNGVATAILVSRKLGTTEASSPGSAVVVARVLPEDQPPDVPPPEDGIQNAIVEVQFVSQVVADIRLGVEPLNRRGLDIVGNDIRVTAQVVDANNNPVPDNTAVYFTVSHGMIRGDAGGSVNGVALSYTVNGVAQALLLTPGWLTGVPDFDGTVDITVAVGGPPPGSQYPGVTQPGLTKVFVDACVFSGPATINPALPPDRQTRIVADRTPPEVHSVQDSMVITVYAYDENGQPVEDGTAVRLRASKGTLDAESLTTVGGVVTTTLRTSPGGAAAPTATGPGTIQAFIATGIGPDFEPPPLTFTVIP